MWDHVPRPVRSCCAVLWAAGYDACPVGGCVRDLLLGRTPGDWDIATAALPEAVTARFPHTVPTGLKHGTVTVLWEGMTLEVTTFRREGAYTDGRRPDGVRFDAGLEADLSRRDFTINAMALGPDGRVTDPFGGRADLEQRLIRCVGDPEKRFSEDALRLFRAARFAAQLGFTLEAGTRQAMTTCAPLADRLSGERVKAEVEKLLRSPRPALCALLVDLGMLARFGARPAGLAHLNQTPNTPVDRWSALCAATGLDITLLPVERALRRGVLHPELRALASLALTGRELYDLGYRGGAIGAARRALLDHVRAHPEENEKGRLLALLQASEAPPQ